MPIEFVICSIDEESEKNKRVASTQSERRTADLNARCPPSPLPYTHRHPRSARRPSSPCFLACNARNEAADLLGYVAAECLERLDIC